MHRVAEVRHDEREVGQRAGVEVSLELRQRHDPPAPRGARDDVAEVQERHVLLGVAARERAGEARTRQALGIRLPAAARRLERVGEVPRSDDARGAVVVDALCSARDERDVVRQARVGDAVVPGEPHVAARQRGEGRRRAGADHDDVGEVRDPVGRMSDGTHDSHGEKNEDEAPQAFSSTTRRRQTCSTTITMTTTIPPAIAA